MRKSIIKSIAMLALMLVSVGAWAQGGASPYVNSTHHYTVTPGNAGNTLNWTVQGGVAGTNYQIISGQGTGDVEIKWLIAGAYTVQFTETSAAPESCSTVREQTVNVQANSFAITITPPANGCADKDGTVFSGNTFTSTRVFNVSISGGAPAYTFDYQVASSNSNIASVVVNDGTSDIGNTASATGVTTSASSFTVTVTLNSQVGQADDITLAIKNAVDKYNTPEKTGADIVSNTTIYALPATTGITTD